MSGTLDDYDTATRDLLAATFAADAGVSPLDVTLSVTPASVLIAAHVSVPEARAATAEASIATRFASSTSATSFLQTTGLNVTVEAINEPPTLTYEPSAATPSAPAPAEASGGMLSLLGFLILVAVVGGAFCALRLARRARQISEKRELTRPRPARPTERTSLLSAPAHAHHRHEPITTAQYQPPAATTTTHAARCAPTVVAGPTVAGPTVAGPTVCGTVAGPSVVAATPAVVQATPVGAGAALTAQAMPVFAGAQRPTYPVLHPGGPPAQMPMYPGGTYPAVAQAWAPPPGAVVVQASWAVPQYGDYAAAMMQEIVAANPYSWSAAPSLEDQLVTVADDLRDARITIEQYEARRDELMSQIHARDARALPTV